MKYPKIAYSVTVLGALFFAMWVWGWGNAGQYSEDPDVAAVEKFRDENIVQGEPTREVRDQMRTQVEGLSPEQRMAFFESSMPIFVPMMARRFEEEYDKFMALSPAEQQKKLDERIDSMEKRGGPGGPPPDIDAKKMDEIRKKMLDWTTPEQRAKFDNGIQLLNKRRSERGLPPIPPMGGF